MAGDSLGEILELARRVAPDVPEEIWARIEGRIRMEFGGQRHYFAAQKKRRHLDAIEAASAADVQADADALANLLGLSVRRVRQLNRLRKR
jgi:hypothetical protein